MKNIALAEINPSTTAYDIFLVVASERTAKPIATLNELASR